MLQNAMTMAAFKLTEFKSKPLDLGVGIIWLYSRQCYLSIMLACIVMAK